MPNRVIRSGFLDSEKVNAMKPEEQLFFIRLMLVADDFGCFDARPEMLRSTCYPVSDIRLTDVSKWLARCCQVGLVTIYVVLGKKYLVIHNFDQRLRQRKRKYPEPIDITKDTECVSHVSGTCQSDDGQLHARMPESESESEKNIYSSTPMTAEEIKESKTPPDGIGEDEWRCARWLAYKILEHTNRKISQKILVDWSNVARLMFKRDFRSADDTIELITQCHDMPKNANGFTWADVILSMEKLRYQWNEGKIKLEQY